MGWIGVSSQRRQNNRFKRTKFFEYVTITPVRQWWRGNSWTVNTWQYPLLSPFPDQGGAKIRESNLSPKTGKSFTNHQYVTINSRENCPLLLSISLIPRRKPTTILIGRKIIRPKVHFMRAKLETTKGNMTSNTILATSSPLLQVDLQWEREYSLGLFLKRGDSGNQGCHRLFF